MLPHAEWSRVGNGYRTTKIEMLQKAKIERLSYTGDQEELSKIVDLDIGFPSGFISSAIQRSFCRSWRI